MLSGTPRLDNPFNDVQFMKDGSQEQDSFNPLQVPLLIVQQVFTREMEHLFLVGHNVRSGEKPLSYGWVLQLTLELLEILDNAHGSIGLVWWVGSKIS